MFVCRATQRRVLGSAPQVFALAVVFGLAAGVGWASAADTDPEGVLRAKGLLRRGNFFCVQAEIDLNKTIAGPRTEAFRRKKAVDEAQAAATAAQAKFDEFEKQVRQWRQTYDALNVQYAALAPTSSQANRLAQQINQLVALLNAAPSQFEQAEKSLQEARTTAAQHREEFIQYVMKLGQDLAALEEQYKKLGADPEIQKALADYTRSGKKGALGPAKSTLDAIHRLEAAVITDSIPIQPGADRLFRVFVTINERKPMEMGIDTGASLVVLPYKMAMAVNLYISGDAQKIKLRLADGQTEIDADLVTAPSIRVGRFVAKNVKCAVLPANLDKAEAMLGMSFLGQYNFKIDKEHNKLILAAVGGQSGGRSAHASASSSSPASAGTPPASAAAAPAEPAADAAKPKTKAEQLLQLLSLPPDEAAGQRELSTQGPNGKLLVFRPARRGPAKKLQEHLGDPDEIRKVPGPRSAADDESAQSAPWKIWTWGNVYVLVDDTGTTRYVAVLEP
jgi:clan AA aspartic protease (TIGR02281 family)